MKSNKLHNFDKVQFEKFLREARRLAREVAGTEICGLIIDTGHQLSFVPTRNVSSRVGSFALSRPDVRRVVAATKILGQKVVGTFHSHPVGIATPGKSDIKYAVDGSLIFIFDCIGRKGSLWKIKNGKAHSLNFDFTSP
ncbi:MAG: Mov34/MPN/PAD-1 family protein [Limisphaerales bacterium]